MTRQIRLKGYRITKGGKVVKDFRRLPVNLRLQKQASRKVRVAKRTAPQ